MNDPFMQLLELTLSAKHYLRTGDVLAINQTNIRTILFRFMEASALTLGGLQINWRTRAIIVNSVEKWLRLLVQHGLLDICLVADPANEYWAFPEFTGMHPNWSICCRYAKQSTQWLYQWRPYPKKQLWDVAYAEDQLATYPVVTPENPMCRFRETLRCLTILAQIQGQSFFADVLEDAHKYLTGAKNHSLPYPMLPEENKRLLSALFVLQTAWTRETASTWNDTLQLLICEQEPTGSSEISSVNLYRDLMAAVLYAVNVW